MPHEMVIGRIEFCPPPLDTHSAAVYAEQDRLKKENDSLRAESERLRKGLVAARAVFISRGEIGYANGCDTFLTPNVM